MGKKYLVLCNRHDSIFGDNFCLWWGCRDSKSGYTSDIRLAHRFDESEISEFNDSDDLPISTETLGVESEYTPEELTNKSVVVLMEKGELCSLTGLVLLNNKKQYCHNCGEEI